MSNPPAPRRKSLASVESAMTAAHRVAAVAGGCRRLLNELEIVRVRLADQRPPRLRHIRRNRRRRTCPRRQGQYRPTLSRQGRCGCRQRCASTSQAQTRQTRSRRSGAALWHAASVTDRDGAKTYWPRTPTMLPASETRSRKARMLRSVAESARRRRDGDDQQASADRGLEVRLTLRAM